MVKFLDLDLAHNTSHEYQLWDWWLSLDMSSYQNVARLGLEGSTMFLFSHTLSTVFNLETSIA